jgi:hypothetical protein
MVLYRSRGWTFIIRGSTTSGMAAGVERLLGSSYVALGGAEGRTERGWARGGGVGAVWELCSQGRSRSRSGLAAPALTLVQGSHARGTEFALGKPMVDKTSHL